MPSRIALLLAVLIALAAEPRDTFRFVILGDRTGGAAPGIYEKAWQQAAALDPAFVLTVGDTIEGVTDAVAEPQWRQIETVLVPWIKIPHYFAPGNHDVWSEASEELYEKYSGHPRHYSFDYGPAHFTVLDNSRTEDIPESELAFLEADLKAHAAQPVKFIVSHRPSWVLKALLRDPDFPLQKLARQYGVQYVIAGHIHQMLHYKLDGVEYVSMPSAGGHLRDSGKYEDGWFFGYTEVEVRKNEPILRIHDLQGHVTPLTAWGAAGLR